MHSNMQFREFMAGTSREQRLGNNVLKRVDTRGRSDPDRCEPVRMYPARQAR